MKRILAIVLFVGLSACRSSTPSIDDLSRSTRDAFRRGDLSQARALADRGAKLTGSHPESPDAWTVRLLRIELSVYDNRLADARSLLSDPVPSGAPFDRFRARHAYLQARVAAAGGGFGDALALAQHARILAMDPDDRFDIDEFAGQLLLRLGRWGEGESALQRVVADAGTAGDTYHQALALNDLGMGSVIRSRFDEALPWFERILAVDALRDFALYPRAEYNAGICYTMLGQFDRAAAMQRAAVERYARRGATRDREQALGQLGSTLLMQGSVDEGVAHLTEAYHAASGASLSDDAAIWAGNLAAASIDVRNWADAKRFNDEARRIKTSSGSRDLVHNTLNDAQIAAGVGDRATAGRLFAAALAAGGPPDVVWEAHAGLAEIALADGQRDRADGDFQAALDTIEATRSDLLKSDYKVSFLARLIRFYQAYVNALVDEHQAARALAIADASRARVLAEREGVAAPRRADGESFRRLAGRSGAVLLSYWLGDERSYLWIVTPARIDLVPLPPAKEIDALVRAHQAAIASALSDPLSGAAGEQLFTMLVAPALKAIRPGATVVVVPDGILHGLNFETLTVAAPKRHFWIEDVQVEVAPSLSMLSVSEAARPRDARVLAVGDAVPRPPEFPALAFGPAELQAIAAHFGAERVTRLEGDRASPRDYREAGAGRFTFIHFAAHATANVESPLDSAIILSGGANGFKLYARDVADEPLEAELVTVSACRSAGERAYAGEGLIGFAWAFLHAGARHVVAGLWDVDDRSTAALMDALYGRLAVGDSPGTALRRAKLALLEQGGTVAKPYYWAAFELFTVALREGADR